MRFSVRSLGGKLVISAALMLLLCMLLFSVSSWYALKFFYEHEASIDAKMQLPFVTSAYKSQVDSITKVLSQVASKSQITSGDLSSIKRAPLTSIFLVSQNGAVLLEDGDSDLPEGPFLK